MRMSKQDEDERTVWIETFRHSSKTLGEVILEVYKQRDQRWEVPVTDRKSSNSDESDDGGRKKRRNNKKNNGGGLGKFASNTANRKKKWSRAMRDGRQICPAFGNGTCKETVQDGKCKKER